MKKEIVIIGGGIVGSTAAFYLSYHTDYQITLIDNGQGTATRAAAGIICPWLSQRRNQDWYHLTAQGANFYLQLMKDLSQAGMEQLPYHQAGTLVFKNQPHLLEKLYRLAMERRQKAEMIGYLEIVEEENLKQFIPVLETQQGAVLTSGGGRLDGSALLDSLQELFIQNGGTIIKGQAQLSSKKTVLVNHQELSYDQVILSAGAWLPQILEPLGYKVDIKPQKGQLLEVTTDFSTTQWPGCMLHGEIDILPFEQGRLVIGASHENNMGYDLEVDEQLITDMKTTASQFIPSLENYSISNTRVGIRAYTSDFLPFYGALSDQPSIWVASGLGSSGLTSGPFIGWQIAREILGLENPFDMSPFSPDKYITK